MCPKIGGLPPKTRFFWLEAKPWCLWTTPNANTHWHHSFDLRRNIVSKVKDPIELHISINNRVSCLQARDHGIGKCVTVGYLKYIVFDFFDWGYMMSYVQCKGLFREPTYGWIPVLQGARRAAVNTTHRVAGPGWHWTQYPIYQLFMANFTVQPTMVIHFRPLAKK